MGFPSYYLDIRPYLSYLGFTCWIWAGKRDMRASIPSLVRVIISKYVFLHSFHSAAHTAPPHIHLFPSYNRARSRARVLIVLLALQHIYSLF